MSKYVFKVGDKVRMKQTCSESYEGKIYTLIWHPSEKHNLCVDLGQGRNGCSCIDNWIPVKNNEVKVFGISIFLDSIKGMGK